ncbi:MAG: flagellar export chaperone FlgN [Planctomycetota bacterium]
MTQQTAGRIEKLIEGLEAERGIYERMLKVAQALRDLITKEEETRQMLALVQEEQRMVREIEVVEKDLSDAKREWEVRREHIEPNLRQRVEGVMDGVRKVLEELMKVEEDCRKRMESHRQVVAKGIQELSRAKEAGRAYHGSRVNREGGAWVDQRE